MTGELARAAWPDGTVWRAPLGTLRVRLATARGTPVANALVSLTGTPYFAMTGSNGTAGNHGLRSGPLRHSRGRGPRLAEIGIATGATLTIAAVRDSTVTITLAAPTAENFAAERVRGAARLSRLGFRARPSRDRRRPPRGRREAHLRDDGQWRASPRWHRERASTSRDGVFVSCVGWKVGDVIRVRVNQTAGDNVDANKYASDSSLLLVRIALSRSTRLRLRTLCDPLQTIDFQRYRGLVRSRVPLVAYDLGVDLRLYLYIS